MNTKNDKMSERKNYGSISLYKNIIIPFSYSRDNKLAKKDISNIYNPQHF